MRRVSLAPSMQIVQKCKESNDFCTIDCSGATSGGFLTVRGFPTGYYYTAKNSILTIYKYGESLSSSREIFKNNYGTGTMVVSASYFRLNETSEAVLVLVRQAKTATSADLSYINCISLKTKRLIKSCVFQGKFTKMEVCIDGRQVDELVNMKEGLRALENIIVVGGEESSACLVSLGPLSENNTNLASVPPVKRIPLMRPDEHGFLEYRSDGAYQTFHFKSGRVESLCFMSQRCSLAIGTNVGVIFFVSLKTGRTDSLCLGASVERMVVQHPLNDTDNSLFLWAQLRHHSSTHLILMSTLPNDAKDANELNFIPRFSYVPPNCTEFLQFHSVVLSRQQATTLGNSDEPMDDDSSRDSNASFAIREAARFNQLMIFLYTERNSNDFTLRGSVFDLDGYYSRRMPREAVPDRTSAQQCGFLSHFRVSDLSFDAKDSLDFLLNDIGRFVPPGALGTLDQHFYPSSLYFTFHLLSDEKAVEVRVPCLQDQVVHDVSKDFFDHYRSPSQITQFLYGVGLCNSLADENESVMRTCLFRVLLHNFFPGCMNFLRSEKSDEDMLHFAHKWLGKEVEITKSRFDEESKTLFAMRPCDLPRPALLFANHSQLVFRRSAQLYDLLIDRFQKIDADEDVMNRLKLNKKICEDLLLQISAILFGSYVDLLRDTPENVERLNKVRLGFAERRAIASRLGIQLEIYKIFDDIIDASRGIAHFNELFGRRKAHELYPPDTFTDLLDVLPHFSINLAAKLQILGYFTKDLDYFAPLAEQKQSSFDIACGFLLNDNLTSEAMSEMLTAWNSDIRLLQINQMREVPGMDALKHLSDVKEKAYTLQDLKYMPCSSREERDKLLELYEGFPDGIHKFNLEMIERRRFEMIVDPPAKLHDESDEVTHAREEVARIKRQFPHIFMRNSFAPAILNKCKEQQSRPPHMRVEPSNQAPLQIQLDRPHSTQPLNGSVFNNAKNASESITEEDGESEARFEAFPPRTPISRNQSLNQTGLADQLPALPSSSLQRFGDLLPRLTPPAQRIQPATTPLSINNLRNGQSTSAFPPPSPYISHDASKLIQSSAIKRKDMERMLRLTTPQSVRINRERVSTSRKRPVYHVEDDPMGTPPSSDVLTKPPTSILRDNTNKRQRFSEEPRNIKFKEKQRVLIIPSNHENRALQQAETSFTEFVALNDSSMDEMIEIEGQSASPVEIVELSTSLIEAEDPSTPPIEVEESTPPAKINDSPTPPAEIEEPSTPPIEIEVIEIETIETETIETIEIEESTPPAEIKESTPPAEIKESTPPAEIEESTPPAEIEVPSTPPNEIEVPSTPPNEIEEPSTSPIVRRSPRLREKRLKTPEPSGTPKKSKKSELVKTPERVKKTPERLSKTPERVTTPKRSKKSELVKTAERLKTPEPEPVEDEWLRRNLRQTPERKRRTERRTTRLQK